MSPYLPSLASSRNAHPILAVAMAAASLALLPGCSGDEGGAPVYHVSPDEMPEGLHEIATPVADGRVLVIDDDGQLFFMATDGDAQDFIATMRYITAIDIRLPGEVPDGFVLHGGTAGSIPTMDETAEPRYHLPMLFWATGSGHPYSDPGSDAGTQLVMQQALSRFDVGGGDLVVVAELDGETEILRLDRPDPSGEAPPGPYFLMPPEGSDAPAFSLSYHPSPDGPTVSEDEIVAMLASLVE